MKMSRKEALKRGFEWEYYNPYLCRSDLVAITIMLMVLLLCGIGFYFCTKFFLALSMILGFSIMIVHFLDIMGAVKIKFANRDK